MDVVMRLESLLIDVEMCTSPVLIAGSSGVKPRMA